MGSDRTGSFGAIRRHPWESLLVLLMVLSGALLLAFRSDFGFFLDDWGLVIGREGSPTDWLLPHNEHIVLLPAAIYKLSLNVFGMTAMPIHCLAVALFLTSVGLLFLWLRPLVGAAVAVLFCAVVLFLGSAAEDLIWAFQIGFFGSVASGLAALLLLRKGTVRADGWACLLLVIGLLFSSLGIPFAIGAAVQLLFRQGPRPNWSTLLRRSWVYLVPATVYVIWWLGWGHLAPNSVSAHNAADDPLYVLSAFAFAGSVVTGTFPLKEVAAGFIWAIPGLILLSGLVALVIRRRQVPAALLVAAAVGFSFWALSGLNYIPGREFIASRYQYPGAIFILMIFGGALSGYRPGPGVLKLIAAVALVAVAVNLAALVASFRDTYKPYEERGLVALTAFDISSRTVGPDAAVPINEDGTAVVDARSYFKAVDKYGSPGLNEDQIDGASATNRTLLDQTLVAILPVTLPAPDLVKPYRNRCRILTADATASDIAEVTSSLLYIRPTNQVVIRLGRFGPGVGALGWRTIGNRPTGYRIPEDNSDRAWRIGFQGTGKVTVCPARASG